jgi:TDG/mug DNA glycosylase family protein
MPVKRQRRGTTSSRRQHADAGSADAGRAQTKPRAQLKPRVAATGTARVSSFNPQVGAGCRVLVLGTVPSLRSLEMQQSYAHPHNMFWPFMGRLYDAGPELPYAERIARLHAAGVGIWDVLKDCERPGSLDSSILPGSEVANDIPGLLAAYPTIAAIALNGGKAQQVFARRIAPHIDAERLKSVTILALPSTSPANASIPRDVKLERWSQLLRFSAGVMGAR